jgi:hypothetical protein
MSAQGQQRTTLDDLMAAVESGRLSVSDVFLAMREGRITEDEGRQLLAFIQKMASPRWRNLFGS